MSEQLPRDEERESSPSQRRYGLFGVSAYPKKSGMDGDQQKSMGRWSSALVALLAAAVVLLLIVGAGNSSGLTVTFDSQGGSAAQSQSVAYGGTVEEPENVVRPGYTLVCWSLTPDGDEAWDFASDTVEEGITLYAIWEEE
ncbi:MAG: InlB B-repeat-containing protein [Clostridiales bacterium]|nr:InlB B-repeat-containing protein [Clostridiales bacterium]